MGSEAWQNNWMPMRFANHERIGRRVEYPQERFSWSGYAGFFACTAMLAALAALPVRALDFGEAVAGGNTALGFRYRIESVSQDGIEKDALASTARARLTWNSADSDGFAFGAEADYSLILGIEDFNSTTNGKTQYPVVADPEGFDLNQAFLKYSQDNATFTLGRQRINHGTQRFMGGVAYRNNEQTYDGVRVQASAGALNLDYAFVGNINRIFGAGDGAQPGDWHGNSHVLRATFSAAPGHTLAGYAYLWDLENDNGPANANSTYGLEYVGAFDPLTITAAASSQSDYGENPVAYDATHYLIQGDLKLGGLSITGAYEVVGSDDGAAQFRFPAATLHKFQGWTDKFLIAPPTGVRDAWVSVGGKLGGATVTGVFHDYRADSGGADYGQELGFAVTYPLRDNLSLLLKASHYSADEFATDTTKAWLMLGWQW